MAVIAAQQIVQQGRLKARGSCTPKQGVGPGQNRAQFNRAVQHNAVHGPVRT